MYAGRVMNNEALLREYNVPKVSFTMDAAICRTETGVSLTAISGVPLAPEQSFNDHSSSA